MGFCRNLIFFFEYVLYEITYYFLGAGAIIDDVVSKKSNVCPTRDLVNMTAIVTGGARGIGAALVQKLLQCNMTVILGCRNIEAGQRLVDELRRTGISNGNAIIYKLDLMSCSSIRQFAEEVKSVHKNVHLLVNNAGIMFAPYQETEDGFESHWAVNYLGAVLLCDLLLPILQDSAVNEHNFTPRIVNVTSCAYMAARKIDFNNISMKKRYIPSAAYAQSKLAQILFTMELNRRLELAGSKVSVHCVHPGIVNTDLFDGTLLKKTMPWVLTYVCKNATEGATSVLYSCISPALDGKGGTYSTNCRLEIPGKNTHSVELLNQLYEYTLKSLGISKFGNMI